MNRKLNIAELLENTSFLEWIKKGSPADDGQWGKEETQGVENRALLEDATVIMEGIPFRKQEVDPAKAKAGWEKIEARIKANQETPEIKRKPYRRWAAMLLFLIVSGLALNWYLQSPDWVTVKTAYGATETVILPDHSTIVLGANSQITYDRKLTKRKVREIALKGEAFFKVSPSDKGAPFTVTLQDVFVEVLGTSFNINAYQSEAIISLEEGSLRLSSIPTTATERTSILLEPSQTAWFDQEQQAFVLASEKNDYWTSWVNKEWSFGKGTSIQEVLKKIKTTYGLETVVKDATVLEGKIAGKVSIESPEILFQSLEVYLDRKITRKGQQLIIE